MVLASELQMSASCPLRSCTATYRTVLAHGYARSGVLFCCGVGGGGRRGVAGEGARGNEGGKIVDGPRLLRQVTMT